MQADITYILQQLANSNPKNILQAYDDSNFQLSVDLLCVLIKAYLFRHVSRRSRPI